MKPIMTPQEFRGVLLDWMERAAWALVAASAFFAGQMAAQDAEPRVIIPPPAYLPTDLGERSILWLEQSHGGLMLRYEKHVQVSANKRALRSAGEIAVPVSVD